MDPRQQNIQLAIVFPNGSSTSLEIPAASPPPRHPRNYFYSHRKHYSNIDYAAYRPQCLCPGLSSIIIIRNFLPKSLQPHKHYVNSRWHSPIFGLRRQADLVKLAQQHGVVSLLPYTIKVTRREGEEERGAWIEGQGYGYWAEVKGKLWERTLKGRLEERKMAYAGYACYDSGMEAGMCGFFVWEGCTNNKPTERTWPRVEEVAEIGLFTISGGFCTDTGLVCANLDLRWQRWCYII